MIRQFGPPPEGAYCKTRSNPHDFGTYYELAIYYDEHNEVAVAYARGYLTCNVAARVTPFTRRARSRSTPFSWRDSGA
jgi:hypothetical protein